MDPDPGAHTDLGHGTELEACGGETEKGEGNIKGGDGEFSSASSSSVSSVPSSSALPPLFSSAPPLGVEEEKEMLSGCSKSFTGLKLFTRR